ncbi:ribosomal protein L11 methyltransferase [Agrilactobacillus composti DSM 18527 = JCM 14202]|uniref:Ribosomal protein L11 methyltransferase n=1 Tax=Agrilactobacillus composti DSM 18527 = JCM 14202 TaxID=1423734 RepID=X0PHC2_9LACO|nr:50S ribosomal protein L11 methyltransferase [Agrilactobacillus composti]KRM36879.1 ribosomal protein L11 methyltransferase [Agrilactobacillus composti DSM 18527 = JCM 14202]GAF41388.1 ribosomal protein L11 methyltransferase [Agrilactobacillus composti DSM 18527 = JCM 14202]
MKWHKVAITTTTESIEAVAEILNSIGANGVEIEDSADFAHVSKQQIGPFGEIEDPAQIPHLKQGAVISAYFPDTKNMPVLLKQIQNKLDLLPSYGLDEGQGQIFVSDLDEADWANNWKKYYQPYRVTRFLTVVPNWVDYQPEDPGEIQITLDPGMSFGTGTHPTTILALTALEQVSRGNMSVFDIGTGSGILSIAASKLGAKVIEACDLDDVAVKAAQDNIDLNPSVNNIQVFKSDLMQQVTGKADLILANILAEIILLLIPDLAAHLNPKGQVILSGIIEDKANQVIHALDQFGFKVVTKLQQQEWVALIVTRKEAD